MPASRNLVATQIRAGHYTGNKSLSTFIEIQIVPPLHCRDVSKPRSMRSDTTHTHRNWNHRITHHICATSWLWVPAMRFFAAMSAFLGSTRYAVVRPVIKPYPYRGSTNWSSPMIRNDGYLPSSPSHLHQSRWQQG